MARTPIFRCLSAWHRAALTLVLGLVLRRPARAEDPGQWDTGIKLRGALPAVTDDRAAQAAAARIPGPHQHDGRPAQQPDPAAAANAPAQVNLLALLTADGQQIDQGIVWRIYDDAMPPRGRPSC